MKHVFAPVILAVALLGQSGCVKLWPDRSKTSDRPVVLAPSDNDQRPRPRPTGAAPPPPETARTADEFDTTSEDEREAAAVTPAEGGEVLAGTTVATLGSPAQPGFWLETPLVSAAGPGRVVSKATGESVLVDLLPIEGPAGAGSRISLAALRLLGVSLAGLHELEVYAR
jgi:hypothetical protein